VGLLRTIRASIYSPAFYRELLGKPFSSSVKYYLALIIILAVVHAAVLSYTFVPLARSFLENLGPKVLEFYPDNLVITIDDGVASSNVEEPYRLGWPEGFETPPQFRDVGNFIVVDTRNTFELERFRGEDTMFLLSKDAIAYRTDGGVDIQILDRVPDATVDKSLVQSLVRNAESLPQIAAPFIVFLLFFGALLVLLSNLVYLLFGALLIWGFSYIRKTPLGYKKSYQVGIHAMTLGILLSSLAFIFYPPAGFPFGFTLLLLVVAWVNLEPERASVQGEAPRSTP